jgi:beta-N-acetylhexosaminidase
MRNGLLPLLVAFSLCGFGATARKHRPPAPAKEPRGAAEKWLRSLKPAERAAQLLMVACYGDAPNTQSAAYKEYAALVRDLKVGGLIVLNRVRNGSAQNADPYQMAAFLNRMQRLAKVPLVVGGDFERGASMRVTSTTKFPHLMAYGAANDLDLTRQLGTATAREARAMGIQWIFAPDADVNNNPDNPIINIRSFGEDPQLVSAHVAAFIDGAKSDARNPVLTTAKHFPGHGDTSVDSHIGLGTISASRERMEQVELAPFRTAIQAGVDSVMSVHLIVPAFESEPIPATVSRNIMTGLLREQLGFRGIITTDAMDMQGLSKMFSPGESAVRALEAGVDLLLVPRDAREAVRAILAAVRSGRLTQKRVDESVLRILQAKVKLGLARDKLVDLEAIEDTLAGAEDEAAATQVAERALTAVKNDNSLLPLKSPETACAFVLGSGRFSTQGRDFMDELRARAPKMKATLLDPQLPAAEFTAQAGGTTACQSLVVAAYVTSSAYRGNVALAGNYPAFVEQLLATGKPLAFVAFGNPYLLRAFPSVAAYLATFSTALPSERAAARALLGEIGVTGHLPISIPGLAPLGFGLTIERPQVSRP